MTLHHSDELRPGARDSRAMGLQDRVHVSDGVDMKVRICGVDID